MLSISIGFSQTDDIDNLALELAFQEQDSLKVETSLKIIKALFDIKDYERAREYILKSEKLSNNLNYKKGIAEITYYKSLIYAQKDDYINAVSGYNKSKALFNALNDTLSVAKVNNSIGLIEIKRGNYNRGLQFSLAAIKELEKRNLISDLNLAYRNLAKAYYNTNLFEKAMEFYLKALGLQMKLNDSKGINESHSKLAELYSNKKEHRKAIEYYEKVLKSSESNNDSIRGYVFSKLGGEYLMFNDYDKATKYLIQGYNINTRTKNKAGLLLTLNNLGDLNLKQGRLNIAEKQLLDAGEIAKSLNNKIELLRHYKSMKSLDSTRQRFDKAFVWQREYYELNTSLKKTKIKPVTNTEKQTNIELNTNSGSQPEVNVSTDKVTSADNVEMNKVLDKYKIILYALLAALIVVSALLVFTYLKRNSSIKDLQELEEKNVKIELQNEAFSEQTKHLENVNNVKDKLFSIVSHDLKDSLSSINGFIDLLKDGSLTREEFDDLIPELSENANNASLLLFNLLNWSKSQMQSLEPKPSLFDIQEVFESKVKLVDQRMESKGITLVDHTLRDFAYADRSMFEIVIQNLLANALKFCKNGDTIKVSNYISNGSCIVSIADTGIGVSKENLSKLFKNNSFTTMGTNNEKGTGLGLSICKELVELNHGKIWVESTQGIGSTFYVQLPKSRPNS